MPGKGGRARGGRAGRRHAPRPHRPASAAVAQQAASGARGRTARTQRRREGGKESWEREDVAHEPTPATARGSGARPVSWHGDSKPRDGDGPARSVQLRTGTSRTCPGPAPPHVIVTPRPRAMTLPSASAVGHRQGTARLVRRRPEADRGKPVWLSASACTVQSHILSPAYPSFIVS